MGSKHQVLEQEVLIVSLSLRRLQEFQELCARNWGRHKYMYFPSSHTIISDLQ